MAARLTALRNLARAAFLVALGLCGAASAQVVEPPPPPAPLEERLRLAATKADWSAVLGLLTELQKNQPERYREGHFDYLTARALAATGRVDDALLRLQRFISTGDLFDVPARLLVARLHFARGQGGAAIDLLLPLLQRRDGAVSRRAVRIALDALETRLDEVALTRLLAVHPKTQARERRRLAALRAELLEAQGATAEAAALREEILVEARRDDAAAIVLAKELAAFLAPGPRSGDASRFPDRLLTLLIETARAQRDLELAERLSKERDARAAASSDPVQKWRSRFELGRLYASRGRFAEAATAFREVLDSRPREPLPSKGPKDDAPGTAGFFARVRFNLGAVLEKLGKLDEAVQEFQKVEAERVGPTGLATLQRARLEMRRGRLDLSERLLLAPSLNREPGRIEGLLLLLSRRAEAGDARGAFRLLGRLEGLASQKRLPEPWKSELPFWRGCAAEASGDARAAARSYAALIGTQPYSAAGSLARTRLLALPEDVRTQFLQALRRESEALAKRPDALSRTKARQGLLVGALAGDEAAKRSLRRLYEELPVYSQVLLAPELPDEQLPLLCGDAGACRLLQLGLSEDAEPIVRDARNLATLNGCILAARLAEGADAGPAALEAADALDRRVPDDFLLDLAPRSIARALAPRPFDRTVSEVADEFDVPKDLLYAVMRQESRFDREAASPAAARGLMQLTLPAAGEAAKELQEVPPAYAELYDPVRSLRLGARTLRSLLDRFSSDAPSAVAGYNAGAGQTSLWCGGARSPGEALLAAISYPETRTYFRRVLANRSVYAATQAH